MSANAIAELQQQRAKILSKMKELNDGVSKEQRDLTGEERERFDNWEREVLRLEGQIARDEAQDKREADLARTEFRNGGNGITTLARWNHSGEPLNEPPERGEMLGREERFAQYLERRGLLKNQERYEHVTLGQMIRGLFIPSEVPEVRAALAEGADATGGVSVPLVVMAQFVDALRAAVVCMRAGAGVVPMTSAKAVIARTASDPVCAWRAEAGPVSESEPTFEGIAFTARSLDVLIKASREVVEDSVNLERAVQAAIVGSMACELDRAALVGSGTPPEPKGISNITNVGSVAGGGALTSYDKIMDAVYEILKDNAPMPTAIVMPPRTAIALAKLKTGLTNDNTPLALPPMIADVAQYVTTGLPINEAPGTASRIILGSFDQLYFGIRAELRIQVARELYAPNGQIGFFANLRADVNVAHPESFAMVTGIVP